MIETLQDMQDIQKLWYLLKNKLAAFIQCRLLFRIQGPFFKNNKSGYRTF